MAIADRNLTAGVKLVARFKKEEYACMVEQGEDGKLVFRTNKFHDVLYTSPSAAGSAVMGGTACNGWKFWSREGDLKPAREVATKTDAPETDGKPAAKRGRPAKTIKVHKSQSGAPEGLTRFFCSGCMDTFDALTDETPTSCPQGHADTAAAPAA